MKKLLASALLMFATQAGAQTPVSEQLAVGLVAPFDQVPPHRTYLTAHAPNAYSPVTGVAAVVTHWTFWSDTCQHLADLNVCLTQDDSVVIDPSDMASVSADNTVGASTFDLTGLRGVVTVHSFQTDDRCRDAGDLGYQLSEPAIWGTFSIANLETNGAGGDRMQSLGVDPVTGSITVPEERFQALDLSFFAPETLTASEVIFVTVAEERGDLPHEAGPVQGVIGARARLCDVEENCLSLPDISIGCALFSSLLPGPGSLIPSTAMPASSGYFRLSEPRFTQAADSGLVNEQTWIYAWHLQQLLAFGTASRGTYLDPLAFATPTPSMIPTVTPTPSATPAGTPFATPSIAPTLATTTPGPSGTPTSTGTPFSSVTPLPSGTPESTATPLSSVTPSPQASGNPSASPTATAGAGTPSPAPSETAPTPGGPTPSAVGPTPTIFGP